MTFTKQKLTFYQFLEQCPEEGFYELVNGEIVEVRATRNHDDVANLLLFAFNDEIRRLLLNYVVNNTAVIKTITAEGVEQGRKPDVSVIDKDIWRSNRTAYSALEESIQLAVEVTSTNWEDDYIDKLDEYQRLGIKEYWIVDYLAIGLREYLGNPKVPTVFVFVLDSNGKYQRHQFRGSERIISPTFPELTLTAEQILTA
ncbi:Uma2 family endonuclease [Calothrix sp. FACHB-1219]|uniref:Uma2 family endonuclease n=1 Tax=unclassified Calothrix TaxID=2619626 RepID=UPI001688E4F8|nr:MULTISPECIES: Uma2 family endonuclease [unclassified Calothrix]MBD2202914.1 Uma2 family endonuclease [Calothrix sp. FACHB-168]MBD2216042.1 Uma2 family endonuclease [Calothrix sp. FACHB-1219]